MKTLFQKFVLAVKSRTVRVVSVLAIVLATPQLYEGLRNLMGDKAMAILALVAGVAAVYYKLYPSQEYKQ